MMKNKLIILLVLLLSFSFGFPIYAEQQQTNTENTNKTEDTNKTENTKKKENNQAKLTANRVKYKKKENIRIAIGDVVLDYKDNHVTSNRLKMYSENNILIFTENVKLKRPNETITSNMIQLNLSEDQLVAEDNVVLDTTKAGKDLHLTSQYLKLWLESDDMLARKDVYMDYNEQKIRGEALEYNDSDEEMIITKNAEIKENDEWIQSDRIVVDLKTGSIDATGQVKMEFEVSE